MATRKLGEDRQRHSGNLTVSIESDTPVNGTLCRDVMYVVRMIHLLFEICATAVLIVVNE
jgi:hypothetical protein